MSLVDLTSAEAVEAALHEFDALGQDAFLAKYGFGVAKSYFLIRQGQAYDSKAIAGAAHGFEYPERGPLKNSEFSGGEPVRHVLERLGFEVVEQTPTPLDRSDASAAQRVLERLVPAANRTPVLELFADTVEWASEVAPAAWTLNLFRDRWQFNVGSPQALYVSPKGLTIVVDPAALEEAVRSRLEEIASSDADGYPSVPGGGRGYLFPIDSVGEASELTRDALRTFITKAGEATTASPRASAYSAGLLSYLREATGRALPEPGFLSEDDKQAVEPSSTPPDDIHLVVKWSSKLGADTDVHHADVALEHGATWWGLHTKADSDWQVAEKWLTQLRAQLLAGRETFVFISGARCWRTRLLEVQTDRSLIDEVLVPEGEGDGSGHYPLWLKLTEFEPRERDSLLRELDPAVKSGRQVALGNQTNPLFVRFRVTPRVWWVNQGNSYVRSREGGYIWAPTHNKVGGTPDHWHDMVYVRVGDIVLNYANGRLRARSVVQHEATPATRPDPEADEGWNENGRRADLLYADLPKPIPITDIPVEWRTAEGGPFRKDGAVKQAYLFQLSDHFAGQLGHRFPELALVNGSAPAVEIESYVEPALESIEQAVRLAGLTIAERTLRRYHVSLKTRGFVVLAGISGTGKTWLAEAYARAVDASVLVVPVAPNWTTNEDLLGYLNPLTQSYHDTEFTVFLREAAAEYATARAGGREPRPYHLVLDEMNLARVEYYFAKFLSAMELRERSTHAAIELAPGNEVALTSNLKFIGTVNVDETTHGFADKVYDRAQLLELTIDQQAVLAHLDDAEYAQTLSEVWSIMKTVAPFAFRVLDEITAYLAHAADLGVDWETALDEALLQKVLPKVKGTDLRLKPSLQEFIELAADHFPLSAEKATAMRQTFNEHGFTSYF